MTGAAAAPVAPPTFRRVLAGVLGERHLSAGAKQPLTQAVDTFDALSAITAAAHVDPTDPQRRTAAAVIDEQLPEILREHDWAERSKPSPSPAQAWALANSLRALWIRTAADDEVAVAVKYLSYPPPPEDLTPEYYRAWLVQSHSDRQRVMAYDGVRAEIRGAYLTKAGVVLAVLVAATWAAASLLSSLDTTIALCALAGGIGGAVHGARGLRDSQKLRDTKAYQTWWWVQPFVGASAGLLIVALFTSGVLVLPGTGSADATARTAALIVYAFLAGFSEPWLLGILDRIGADDKAADDVPPPARVP